MLKRCSRCAAEKPLEAFHVKRSNRSGRCAECKVCRSIRDKAHYRKREAEEPGFYLVKNRRQYRKHVEKCLARAAGWRLRNPDKVRRHLVKKDLADSLGVSCRYISDEIVEAKLTQLAVLRLLKEAAQ